MKHEMHGLRKHPLYSVWANVKTRCTNKNDKHYDRWGNRGITICSEWRNSFQAFYNWSMSNGYSKGLTIDRINNNEGYSPGNCRFVSIKEQNQNKRNIISLTYEGKTMSATAWAKELGWSKNTVLQRYHWGWTVEECLFGKAVM